MKAEAAAYFHRIDERHFQPTAHVGGAWNIAEQHVAPVIGLLAHAVEADHAARRTDRLQLARLSYDIWGTIPMEAVRIDVTVIRPGRTIELVEARLCHGGRPAVVLRAWLTQAYDSSTLSGDNFSAMPPPETMAAYNLSSVWAGGFIASIDVRRNQKRPGRARCWLRSSIALLDGTAVSATARLMGLVDIANGLCPLASPQDAAFPNIDLTAHLLRSPRGEWIGLDTTVSASSDGIGLTHSIVHDEIGAFGTVCQSLTIRPKI